jgi:hypothetical protein
MKPLKHFSGGALCLIIAIFSFAACTSEEHSGKQSSTAKKYSIKKKKVAADVPQGTFRYHFISIRNKNKALRDSFLNALKSLTPAERAIVLRLNRVDAASYKRLDTMVVPDKIDTNWMAYSVFPAELPMIKDVHKMVFFAYYPEAFGAYENGRLIRWGPSNMGKKTSPTPTGLFSANWKARETVSTVNDEWKLKWNFNVMNAGGVGWHEYQLPGYPASHSCMRLLEADAMWLYNWAEMWLQKDDRLAAQGTPVIIFGQYPFGKPKPWWSLVQNPAALNLPADTLNALIQPNLAKILARQAQRDSVVSRMPKKAPKDSAVLTASVKA